MTILGPTLETDRLILRPPEPEDFEPLAGFLADPVATELLGGPVGPEIAWTRLSGLVGHWVLKGYGMFCVVEKATGRWLGRVGPLQPLGWPGPEVGWGLVRDSWGRGYATEAAGASMDWAFDHLGWTEAIHCINPANAASQAVARLLGSTSRGPGRLPPPIEASPVDIWGQTRAQWRARRV